MNIRRYEITKRDWCVGAEQLAPEPDLAHLEGCAALRIVLVSVPRVTALASTRPATQRSGFRFHGFMVLWFTVHD